MLQNGGVSPSQKFNIKLEGCDVSALANKTITTAFNGVADGDNLKLQSGTASGATIVIEDSAGKPIKINSATGASPEGIGDGTNTLHFSAYLKGNTGSSTIKTGNFASVASFMLSYQ
ncbi:Fimbria A protein precursor [Serratia fonticola]|nr:Fimbria A protein precursor [Serratia fonticola]